MWLGFIGDFFNENFMVFFFCSFSVVDVKVCKWKRRGVWRGVYFLF